MQGWKYWQGLDFGDCVVISARLIDPCASDPVLSNEVIIDLTAFMEKAACLMRDNYATHPWVLLGVAANTTVPADVEGVLGSHVFRLRNHGGIASRALLVQVTSLSGKTAPITMLSSGVDKWTRKRKHTCSHMIIL